MAANSVSMQIARRLAQRVVRDAIEVKVNRLRRLEEQFNTISNLDLLVGVPSDRKDREDEPWRPVGHQQENNATIAYLNDRGSPANNIPPRPFMQPGIESAKDEITAILREGIQRHMRGNQNSIMTAYRASGLICQNKIRAKIVEGIPPPLAEKTLLNRIRNAQLRNRRTQSARGARKELASRAAGNMPSASAYAKPLIETGQLKNSITYVIRRRHR